MVTLFAIWDCWNVFLADVVGFLRWFEIRGRGSSPFTARSMRSHRMKGGGLSARRLRGLLYEKFDVVALCKLS
jgi:hypothetical protein